MADQPVCGIGNGTVSTGDGAGVHLKEIAQGQQRVDSLQSKGAVFGIVLRHEGELRDHIDMTHNAWAVDSDARGDRFPVMACVGNGIAGEMLTDGGFLSFPTVVNFQIYAVLAEIMRAADGVIVPVRKGQGEPIDLQSERDFDFVPIPLGKRTDRFAIFRDPRERHVPGAGEGHRTVIREAKHVKALFDGGFDHLIGGVLSVGEDRVGM